MLTESEVGQLLYLCHASSEIGGHRKRDATLQKIKTNYWFPNMEETVIGFINSCEVCSKVSWINYK